MKNLEVGMRVRGVTDMGKKYTAKVYSIHTDEDVAYLMRDDGVTGGGIHVNGYGNTWCACKTDGRWMSDGTNGEELELISDGKIVNKNMKEKFALIFKSEPEKSFRVAGITNEDDFLTTEGNQIFLSWLLKKHGVEFKKEVVDALLKKEE